MQDITDIIASTLTQMGIEQSDCFRISIDEMTSVEDIYPFLEKNFAQKMIIFGGWETSIQLGVDIYDQALKFVEDRFTRARVKKSAKGWYLLIAMEPL